MFSFFLSNTLAFTISLSALIGIVVHDTRIDRLTSRLLAAPVAITPYEGVDGALKLSEQHTHIERVSVSQRSHSFAVDNPRVQPRQDEKKYRLGKHVPKGHHPFDDYSLPVLS